MTLSRETLLQATASLLITCAFRSVPQAALNILLHLNPLSLFVEEQRVRCALRLKELKQ